MVEKNGSYHFLLILEHWLGKRKLLAVSVLVDDLSRSLYFRFLKVCEKNFFVIHHLEYLEVNFLYLIIVL